MGRALRLGDLESRNRPRVAAILESTGVFSMAEIEVALELFDGALGMRDERQGTRDGRNSDGVTPSVVMPPLVPSPSSLIPDYSFIGAFDAEELLGYACYGPTPDTDRAYDLYWIAVDRDAHGSGVGSALLAEVEQRLAAERVRMLVVETSSRTDYAATRDFYERRGYREAARLREFYAPGEDRIIFTKRIHHSPFGGEQSRHE